MIGGTAYTTCPLCEATCGLELELSSEGEVLRVKGDVDDVFSFRVVPNHVLPNNRIAHEKKAARAKGVWPELTVVPWNSNS